MNVVSMLKVAVAGVAMGAVCALTGCAAENGSQESVDSAEQALPCTDCGGDPYGGGLDPPTCNSATQCCISGSQTIANRDNCEWALQYVGCKKAYNTSTTSTTKLQMKAVHTDGQGSWWFRSACPNTAYAAAVINAYCSQPPYSAYVPSASNPLPYGAKKCFTATPTTSVYDGSTWMDVIWDPTCPRCTILY